MSTIQRIDNVGVAVRDLGRAEDFYTRLGFTVKDREQRSLTVAAGDARLWIFQTSSSEQPARRDPDLMGNPPGVDHLSLWVGDVDAAQGQAQGRGLEFEGEPGDTEWGFRMVGLTDPDGNRIYLLGDLKGASGAS